MEQELPAETHSRALSSIFVISHRTRMYDLSSGMENTVILLSQSAGFRFTNSIGMPSFFPPFLLLTPPPRPARLLTRLNAMRNDNRKQNAGRSTHLGKRLGDRNENLRRTITTMDQDRWGISVLAYYYLVPIRYLIHGGTPVPHSPRIPIASIITRLIQSL